MKGNKKGKKEIMINKKCLNEFDIFLFFLKIVFICDIFFFVV